VLVTLTFDNGPTPGVTDRVLDMLAEREVLATFFVVGAQLRDPAAAALAQRAVAEGHRVGNHSLDHGAPLGTLDDPAEVVRQIDEARRLIDDLGLDPDDRRLFRPAGDGGIVDERLLGPHAIEHLSSLGATCVVWNAVPRDWEDRAGWVDRALDQVGAIGAAGRPDDWAVLVVHDVELGALPRLPELLDRLEDAGAELTQDLPESCVLLQAGRPTRALARLGSG
jgi:peptidoglycan/xylan/chitin deacetylase (PgdA/CDA1 family)